ncbi:hypothetical protein ABKN59_000085 [Abortiporus biennis]
MSISVDDLVATLSSNHIGQEAMDLAALQAQLSQTLFCPSYDQQQKAHHPTNTPTCRTPSSSFCWDRSEFHHDREPDVQEMDEDEQMVEDMLCQPSSPVATHVPYFPSPPASPSSSYSASRKYNSPSSQTFSSQHEYSTVNGSLFTTTDPFYMAQVQASQKSPASYFTHNGRPSQQSPFMIPHQNHTHPFAHRLPNATEVDPHSMFAASSAAF